MHWRRRYRRHRRAISTAASGVLYVGGWSLGYLTAYDAASTATLLLAVAVGGYDVVKTAYHELRNRTLGIKTLVTVAALGAIGIGEYWEAAAVVFLFRLGSYLEARTMRRTRAALQELLALRPETALVRRDGDLIEVPADDVETGERVVVRPGDELPVDGVVVDGESTVNQAPVTGESTPVRKRPDDEVYAGTVNQDGALEVETTGAGADTTLQRIVRRVEEAQEAKTPTEDFVDRFATYYTPAVVALAVAAYLLTRDALLALTLLVVACPGALVIGPPVSVVSAIGNAARAGVLVKGGEHLERAGDVDLVAFDKTGTLTRGETTVAGVRHFGDTDADAGATVAPTDAEGVLRVAAIAEKRSEHHLAGAILDAARTHVDGAGDGARADGGDAVGVRGRGLPDPDDFEVAPGRGVLAHYEGHAIAVGNRALLDDRGIAVPDRVVTHVREREEAGETAVYVAVDGEVVGVVALRDELRAAAADVVASLSTAGVETAMLTGDNERTARAVAEAVGIDEYRAELLPADKQAAVESYREAGHVVAMVGDGINDAPSLAAADVGIAMGAAGTDTAIETADVALMADDLTRVPDTIRLGEATRRNVAQNVGVAVLTVGLLLAGVLTNAVHLAGGMLVHEGSVLLVILNGMRLLRH